VSWLPGRKENPRPIVAIKSRVAGINVEEENKWLTIIQNASHKTIKS
jgi:hypothetical protein